MACPHEHLNSITAFKSNFTNKHFKKYSNKDINVSTHTLITVNQTLNYSNNKELTVHLKI